MIYFQSLLALYESTSEEKQNIVVQQMATFINNNKQFDSFFQFLIDSIETTTTTDSNRSKSILNVSIDYINSQNEQNPQFSLPNIKLYFQFLLKLFSIKTQPLSYSKYNDFLRTSFRILNQYDQEVLFSSISKIPIDQSIIPLSIFSVQNESFYDKILSIFIKSFSDFRKEQKLTIWSIAMTTILSSSKQNSKEKQVFDLVNDIFVDKSFTNLEHKFNLFEAALKYLSSKLGDDLTNSHFLNLISLVSPSSSLADIRASVNLAKTVLIHIKNKELQSLTSNQLIDSVFKFILPNYRSDILLSDSLTSLFDEMNKEALQSKIKDQINSENISLPTLFLISRYPTHDTIPYLLTQQKNDQKNQYGMIIHFFSNNNVPYRFLPRLFSILEVADLHFLNEIFEKKPVLYCTSAIKFMSLCKSVEKIEFIASLFKSAKSVPIINSPYAQKAFIVVACLRAISRNKECPIRILLDYLNTCMNTPKNDTEEEEDNDKDIEEILKENVTLIDKLDLTNEDVIFITKSSKENSKVLLYDVNKKWEELNKPKFCQSKAIQSMISSNIEKRDSMISDALEMMNEDDAIYSIVIGSISTDPVIIHNCIQILAISDISLLSFFFTSAATCNQTLIFKEMRNYITKEQKISPSQQQQKSFVSRLFSSKSNTISKRQRIVRECIIGIAPFISFSIDFYETLLASFPTDSESPQSDSSNEKVKSNQSSLVLESIIEVCKRITKKEDLSLILRKLISLSESFEDHQLLSQTFIYVLNSNKNLSDKDLLSLTKVWINLLLIDNKFIVNNVDEQCFESALLNSNKNASKCYLKEIESAISIHGDVPSLFASFKRALPFIPDFNLSKQPQLLTLIISNTLSENDLVLEFCVNLLRSTFEMNTILNPLKGVVFSKEYTESVRPFFTELSSKFQNKQLVSLTETLLSFYLERQPKHQESIFLFIIFAILNQPQLFMKNKFIPKLIIACERMTRNNDYAVMHYLSRAFDALNKADQNEFFNEFISVNSCEFVNMYFSKYSVYYETLEPLLIPRILQLRTMDGKWKEYLEFERLLNLLNGFVKFYVKDTTGADQISRIIFSFLLSISTINIIRNRGLNIDLYISILEKTLFKFKNLTGIYLINTNSHLYLRNETDFYEFVSFFAQSFQFMQFNIVQSLISLIESLIKTKHCECGILCLSSYLVSISNSSSSSSNSDKKRQKNHIVELFTSFLKNCKYESSLIEFIVARFPSCFTVQTLNEVDQNYLSFFLKLNFDTISKSSDVLNSFHFILNIIRSSTASFIQPYVQQIMTILKDSVSNGQVSLKSILALNIIGEIGRRKQDPILLLKDGPVSFRSLSPLLLSDEDNIRTRVNAIFSLMIFGKSEMEPDFELVFTSLMSLFVGYENDSSNYVSIANNLLKNVEKILVIKKKHLKLLKFAFQPVLSVSDSVCTVAICDLLKYLKKLSVEVKGGSNDNDELFLMILGMMTLFAKPKRNFPISTS